MKKTMKALTTGLAALLAATALACVVPSAANADDLTATLTFSADCIPQGEERTPLIFTYHQVPGQGIYPIVLDGRTLPGDAGGFTIGEGTHVYSYTVQNLNNANESVVKGPFTFTVEICEIVVTPQAPTQSGDTVTTTHVPGVTYTDEATGDPVESFVLKDGETRCVVAIGDDYYYSFPEGATTRWCFTYHAVSFLDVPGVHPFAREIAWMADQGITTGYEVPGGREFRPYGTVGRDAMAAFLYRFAGSPEFSAPSSSPFTDVPTSHPFYKEISWLASTGVSTGWDVGGGKKEFRPSQPIARDAMAAFLYRFAGKPDFTAPPVSSFTDVPMSHPFYTEISWLASTGVTTGWDVGGGKKEFRPSLNITRDAMAAFLYRYNAWLD